MKTTLISILILFILFSFACGSGQNDKMQQNKSQQNKGQTQAHYHADIKKINLRANEKLHLVATTTILSDVLSKVVRKKAVITGLITPGQDPHSYDPPPKDIAIIEKAHIIFINGFGLEELLLEILKENSNAPIIEVSEGINPIAIDHEHHEEDNHHLIEGDSDQHEADDPHTWTSPRNVIIWVENILGIIVSADPQNAVYYESQAKIFLEELEDLDQYIYEQVVKIPAEKRVLISDHRVFEYFARDYGFKTPVTISGSFSTNAEPSAKELVKVIHAIKETSVSAIFLGTTATGAVEKLARVISLETGHAFKVLPVLTGSLTSAGGEGPSYINYMKYNVNQFVSGLIK